jgi:hypothetical protein
MQHIKFVDGIRLTQRRVRENSCLVSMDRFRLFDSSCYGPTWLNGRLGARDTESFTGAVSGVKYVYNGTSFLNQGFVYMLCGASCRQDSRRKLQALRLDKWVNEGTSYLRTDFLSYNPNVGLFTTIQVSLDIHPSGAVFPTVWIQSIDFQVYATQLDYVRLGLEFLFLVSLLVFCVQEVMIYITLAHMERDQAIRRKVKEMNLPSDQELSWSVAWHTLAFTKNFWAAYDCVLLVVMLVIVLMRLYVVANTNFKENTKVLEPSADNPSFVLTGKNGDPIDYVDLALVTMAYNVLCGLVMVMCSFKMIKYLQLNIQMSILTQTFVEMSAEMYTFVFVLAILNGVWTSMAVILFGSAVNSFKDFSTSFET